MKESKEKSLLPEVSRRSFLKGAGLTSLVAVGAGAGFLPQVHGESPKQVVGLEGKSLLLQVNGKQTHVQVEPRATLAEVLRDQLHLTGTKVACDRAACGACTVLFDGKPVPACMTLALDAEGHHIQTVEGLAQGDQLDTLQNAFISSDALQCGFCTSGMIMSCTALLEEKAEPTRAEINQAISGNLCRCGTYPHVVDAVLKASAQGGK